MMFEGLQLPEAWFGSLPTWGMFFLLLYVAIKVSPEWIKAWFDEAKAKRQNYGERIKDLEQQVKDCQEECERAHRDYRKQIIGLEAQRIQEQISLIAIIMQTVDNPLLRAMFEQLQSTKSALRVAEHVGGPLADSEGAEHEGKFNEGE